MLLLPPLLPFRFIPPRGTGRPPRPRSPPRGFFRSPSSGPAASCHSKGRRLQQRRAQRRTLCFAGAATSMTTTSTELALPLRLGESTPPPRSPPQPSPAGPQGSPTRCPGSPPTCPSRGGRCQMARRGTPRRRQRRCSRLPARPEAENAETLGLLLLSFRPCALRARSLMQTPSARAGRWTLPWRRSGRRHWPLPQLRLPLPEGGGRGAKNGGHRCCSSPARHLSAAASPASPPLFLRVLLLPLPLKTRGCGSSAFPGSSRPREPSRAPRRGASAAAAAAATWATAARSSSSCL